MASLIKKIKKGHAYYYAVESGRVDGKPRIVWQKYLGTLDAIIKHLQPDLVVFNKPELEGRFQAASGRVAIEALFPGVGLYALPGQVEAQFEMLSISLSAALRKPGEAFRKSTTSKV